MLQQHLLNVDSKERRPLTHPQDLKHACVLSADVLNTSSSSWWRTPSRALPY